MWELCLLANSGDIGKQSAKEMVNDGKCKCPGYILSNENHLIIQQELNNKLKVSLVLLDRTSKKRYEGQVDTVKGTGREANHQTRWNIRGKEIQPVLFKDEDGLTDYGVRFKPV
jgi:hypothetical protein